MKCHVEMTFPVKKTLKLVKICHSQSATYVLAVQGVPCI